MIIISDKFENINIKDDLSIALGTFDGVHLGHKKIINSAVEIAKNKNIKSAVLTFLNHPLSILKPENKIKIITNNLMKISIIESIGVDYFILIDFNSDFANIPAEEFIRILKEKFKASALVCGYNYTFGKAGIGNVELLELLKNKINFQLKVIDLISLYGYRVSSSFIRKKLELGEVEDANKFLDYNMFYKGIVIEGKKLGRKLGFPTANIIIPENICLKNGVYISRTFVENRYYFSVSNVGYTPTVQKKVRTIETHIINYENTLYGKEIRVEFLQFIRGETKFNSINQLKTQVLFDISAAEQYFFNNHVYNK